VTLIGSGQPRSGCAYGFRHIPVISRSRFERWPKLPFFRNEYMYEELTFAAGVTFSRYSDMPDITVTCGYPYTNWALRYSYPGKRRPPHVFVTQNGDWPAAKQGWEPMFFSCDGLICTNPLYLERNRERWFSTLIPNGIDPNRFHPGPGNREKFGLPADRPVLLMVSALESGKRVIEAIRAVSTVKDAFLVVAGDGALRTQVDRVAAQLLPGRFMRNSFPHSEMPELYRSADLFLHTAKCESFGNVYLEALSSGVPIVAHEDQITRWILGDHAVLLDTESEKALSQAIESALRSHRSDAKEAVEWAHANYSWSIIARRYIEFLDQVLVRK
jgi:glycosyltransferase involved in cell wall biosynthesis